MKKTLYTLLCLSFAVLLGSCDKKEDFSPCFEARVIEAAPCGGGTVLGIKKDGASANTGFCGTPGMYKYVVVDNLPDNLKQEGTTFTCQLKERETEMPLCQAIYMTYEGASIAKICSRPDSAPVVAVGS